MKRVAVIWFPGNNCEHETARAIEFAGMKASILRWNDSKMLDDFDGYVIGGGFAYEDRIRAGVISAKDPVMNVLRKNADNGKPVLGICNGAQVLVESGIVPGLKDGVEMALAPNKNPFVSGYYSTWTFVRKVKGTKGIFASLVGEEAIPIPIAHGEGRFVTKEEGLMEKLQKNGQLVFQYCDQEGRVKDEFPVNPNGSMLNAAVICNPAGNVMAIMPHPERASWQRQIPNHKGTFEELEKPAIANKIFEAMKKYVEK